MVFLQADPSAQVIALIIQTIGALILAALLWLAARTYKGVQRFFDRLDHLHECIETVRTEAIADRVAVKTHLIDVELRDVAIRAESKERDNQIAELRSEHEAVVGWIKGRYGLAIDASLTEIPKVDPIS